MSEHTPATNLTLAGLCRWSIGYALRRWPPLLVVITSLLLKVGLDVLKPWPMIFLIDYILRHRPMPPWLASFANALPGPPTPEALIGWSVAGTVLVFLLSWILGVAVSVGNISLGQRMTYDLARDLFARLQQLSLHFHARKTVGDSMRRVTADCACVSIIVKDALLPVLSSLVTLVAMFWILWRLDPLLTVLAVSVAPAMMLVFRRYAVPMMEASYRQQEAEGKTYDVLEQTFTSMPIMQAFTREDFNDRRFAQATGETISATLSLTRQQLQFKLLIGLTTALGTAAILWVGAHHALAGYITIGGIVAFLSYLGSLYVPLEAIMYTSSTIQGAAGSARRVWEILHLQREVTDRPGARPLPPVRGRVQFERVTFGYEPGRPILHDINLDVLPGETIALVGATGAGKSTLVSLLPRFFDPWEGRLLIDGCDAREVQLKTLRAQVALVLQDPFLFPMSVAENIAYGRPDASTAQIESAARAANAHEFISRLPGAYQAVIGERGATLSGGERQRLSIARALLKDAPILILDEPTSSLDAQTENSLMEALERLTHGRTTFIIAHRLSTVRRAGRIVTLQDGRIVEIGRHAELLARGGVYARFHELQVRGNG